MGDVYQFKKPKNPHPVTSDRTRDSNQPLNTLAALICKAEESNGCLDTQDVLKLAAAAKEAVESLLSDMERADLEAMQEAVLDVFAARMSIKPQSITHEKEK